MIVLGKGKNVGTRRVFSVERRAEPRVCTDGIIGVRIHVHGRIERGTLVDLNNLGAYVATSLVLEKGIPLTLEIEVPGARRLVRLPAEVVRSVTGFRRQADEPPTGIAVKFVAESVAERERIHLVVQTTLALDLLGVGLSEEKW